MHDPTAQLVKMANQIGAFFHAQTPSDPAAAAQAVAAHLRSFWAPSMRAQLASRIGRPETAQLLPVVASALQGMAGSPTPPGA